jgi:predicted dehydrogenase
VLVEKPVTRSLDEFSRLTDEATRRNLALLVDNTFLFTPAVRKLRDIVAGGILGDFSHFDSIRANLGRFRDDVNVFWDLAVHDLVILQYILPDKPVALSAIGVRDVAGHPESIGYLTLFFGSGMIAHINASWLSPRKIRQIVVGGSLRMACYDDVEPDEKLTLYDKCVVSRETPDPLHHLGLGSRRGKKWVLPIEKAEALSRLAEHFRDCIEGTVVPLGDDGLLRRTIELLTAADHSAAQGGRRVSV